MHERFDDLLNQLIKASTVGQEVIGEVLARTSLRSPGPTTRAEIAAGNPTALRKVDQRPIPQGTVSKAVKALTALGLLDETPIKSEGTRWLGELYLGAGWSIAGFHVRIWNGRPTNVTMVIVRLDGFKYLASDNQDVDSWEQVPDVVLDQIARALPVVDVTDGQPRDAVSDAAVGRLLGIGIEVGATVEDGVILAGNDMRIELAKSFRARLADDERFNSDLPVVIETDINALAVKATQDVQYAQPDLVVIAVFDDGVRGGLVMDGRLRRGGNGRAMEIGHLQVGFPPAKVPEESGADSGTACLCGGYGHVDELAPPARIRKALGIKNLLDAEGPQALGVFETAGATLGRAISHVCNVVNPSGIVLYIPAALGADQPGPAGAYISAACSEISRAFNAKDQKLDIRLLPRTPEERAVIGTRAAAACVFQSFIEHALKLDDCRDAELAVDMKPYVATGSSGRPSIRHFDSPVTHAVDVDGLVWSFHPSEEAAEKGADLRRSQGHIVQVVEAKPYAPAP